MSITYYETEDEMDDAFEEEMRKLEDIARLEEEISSQEFTVEQCYNDWIAAREDLYELEMELNDLIN